MRPQDRVVASRPLDVSTVGSLPTSYTTIPVSSFHDADRYRLEIERVFGRHWMVTVRCQDLSNVGALASTVGQTDILVTRDPQGQVVALHNVCSHRGAMLTPYRVDGLRLRCPYHGWTYGLDGRVVAIPGEKRFGPLNRDECGLRVIRTEVWAGWVWVNLSDEGPTLSEYLGVFGPEIDRYQQERQLLIGQRDVEVPVHWSIALDAFNEVYHVHFVHAKGIGQHVEASKARFRYCDPHSRMVIPIRRAMNRHGDAPIKDLLPEQRGDHCDYTIFPNLIMDLQATWGITLQFEPLAIDRTLLRVWMLADPPASDEERSLLEYEWDESVKALDEDVRTLLLVGRGMRSPAFRELRLGGEEERLARFHAQIDRALERGT